MIPPESIAVRVVNEYRRRDLIGYLGLRLYLETTAARRDRWAEKVCVRSALSEAAPQYHEVRQFKSRLASGEIEYRKLFIPTPSETLAEACLLDVCARSGGPFSPRPNVYSYRLATVADKRGVYEPFYVGYRQRQTAVAAAARRYPNAVLVTADIRNFYPSIRPVDAKAAWGAAATKLPQWARELGHKLIENYSAESEGKTGALVGPLFSHLVADLVLAPLDAELSAILPSGYFRYVDDVVLLGSADAVQKAVDQFKESLGKLGMEPHGGKWGKFSGKVWTAEGDSSLWEQRQVSWKSIVGRIKQMAVTRPELQDELQEGLRAGGVRFRPSRYAAVASERSYSQNLLRWLEGKTFRRGVRRQTVPLICADLEALREYYCGQCKVLSVESARAKGHARKVRVQKLRKLAFRLLYVAKREDFTALADQLRPVAETEVHAAMFSSLASGDITELLKYGSPAAYAVADPLKSEHQSVTYSDFPRDVPQSQALAVFAAHGMLQEPPKWRPASGVEAFCGWKEEGQGEAELSAESSPYFFKLSCLHGVGEPKRHPTLLETAFDPYEDLLVRADALLNGSS